MLIIGKSDYIHIIDRLLGDYCTHQDLTQLSTLSNLKKLYQRTANIIDDVMEISRVDFARLHSIITGGTIATKSTGDVEFAFAPYSTIVFGTTHNLDFSSCNDETLRRFRVVPFGAKFDSSTVDRNMTENITAPSCLNIIATRAIQAVNRLGREWVFPEVVESVTNAFFFEGNPVLAFTKSHPIRRAIVNTDYYSQYCIWYVQTFGEECNISIAQFGTRVLDLTEYIAKPHTINKVKDTWYYSPKFNFELLRQKYDEYCQSLSSNESPMSLSKYVEFLDKQDDEREMSVVAE